MSTLSCSLLLSLALVLVGMPALASTRVAVYAIIDSVELEPSNFEPERAWITGVFVVPTAVSSGLHEAPKRGSLYFTLNTTDPSGTRRDWQALRAAAGTGNPVGFGEYWMSCAKSHAGFPHFPDSANSNCSFEAKIQGDWTLAWPEPYPRPSDEGVVTVFDHDDDLCPRFGQPSVEIVVALREAHSPGAPHEPVPACAERVGLIPSSDLASVFRLQERDDAWAAATETLVLKRFADIPGLKLSDLRAECRDTICRVHVAFPSWEYQESEGNQLAANALRDLIGVAPGWKIIDARDAPALDYYFQRRKPN